MLQFSITNKDRVHSFTKMAVSPLILVRLSKFEILHTQESEPLLADLSMVARAAMRAR